MLRVLERYVALVSRISGLKSCSDHVTKCLLIVLILQESHVGEEDAIQQWEKPYLCYYTLDRLFSFSILTARVFALGDPARHTSGTAQKCM
uniref:Uncharacterized protein n=1 Tax=Amphilophus citrinellus TaxID=61819 RepID=A0A3Q0RW82_AMPCI